MGALRLFAHLPDSYRLVLCGAGTDHPAFRAGLARILDAGQQARVELRGPLSDVRPELARASGYLLTTRYEGLPIGALEAWEAGLPLVLSRIDGNSAILSHHPLALPLELSDMTDHASRYAQEVDALISRFLADRDQWQGCIRAAWAAHHDFEGWSGHLCRVVSMMLDRPMREGPMRDDR